MTIPRRVPPSAASTLESRLAAVEDQLAIRDLTARYNFAIDNRDLAAAAELFLLFSSNLIVVSFCCSSSLSLFLSLFLLPVMVSINPPAK